MIARNEAPLLGLLSIQDFSRTQLGVSNGRVWVGLGWA